MVSFIDGDGSGSISVAEFQEVFSMVKRANAQRAMGRAALKVLKAILEWARRRRKSIDEIVGVFDRGGKGYVTHSDIRSAMAVFDVKDSGKVKDAVEALDPSADNRLDVGELGKLLRKAEGEIHLQNIEDRRKRIWDDRFREAEKAALAEQSKQEASFSREELIAVIKFMDPDADDSINLEEFIHAFRRARRAKASENVQAEGKELMLELEQFLVDESFTLIKWFNLMDAR